jgi:UDP-N-acetylglucosamine 2-epimerase (non-hydrolysing)
MKKQYKTMIVFGTRPEAIKMAPVVSALKACAELDTRVCVTAQHRDMLDQVMQQFELTPDYDLDLMTSGQTLADIASRVLLGMTAVLSEWQPDLVLVHGDTTTTAMTALACFYRGIAVAHVEAGLRTGDISSPWPEEFNRRVAGLVTRLHFAPTSQARDHLLRENVPAGWITVTGNTVIDALLSASARIDASAALQQSLGQQFAFLDRGKRLLLVTGHRRENFGEGMQSICRAILALARRGDLEIVYPVHRNPNVTGPVEQLLGGQPNIHLLAPQGYQSFVYLMQRSHVILTDSGGIQEEAPALGKPVVVMRETTERPEAVEAGTVRLAGTDAAKIEREVTRLLDDEQAYRAMAQTKNPYGDGTASAQILAAVLDYFHAP